MTKDFVKNLIKYSAITVAGVAIVTSILPIKRVMALNEAVTYTVSYGNGKTARINPGKIVSINAKETNSEGKYLQKWHIKDLDNNELDLITGKTVTGSGEDATAYLYFEMPDMDVTIDTEYGEYRAAVQEGLAEGKYAVYSTSDINDLAISYTASISTGSYTPIETAEHNRVFTLTGAGEERTISFTGSDFATPVPTSIAMASGSSTVASATVSAGQMIVIDEPYIQELSEGRPMFFDGFSIYASDKTTELTPELSTRKIIDPLDRDRILVRTTLTMPDSDIYVVKKPFLKGYKLSLKYDGIAGSYLISKDDPTGSYYLPGEQVTVTLYSKDDNTPYYVYPSTVTGDAADVELDRTTKNMAKLTMPAYDLEINVKKVKSAGETKINSSGILDMSAKKKSGEGDLNVLIDTDDIYFNRFMIEKMEQTTNGVYIGVDDEGMIHMYQKDKSGNIINDCIVGKYNP